MNRQKFFNLLSSSLYKPQVVSEDHKIWNNQVHSPAQLLLFLFPFFDWFHLTAFSWVLILVRPSNIA